MKEDISNFQLPKTRSELRELLHMRQIRPVDYFCNKVLLEQSHAYSSGALSSTTVIVLSLSCAVRPLSTGIL